MDRDMLLFIINLYNRETFFTEEEISYLASVYGIKYRSFSKFEDEGILVKFEKGKRGGAEKIQTNVYVLTQKATVICTKIYDCILGEKAITNLKEVTERHKNINNEADAIVQDILDMKIGIKE